MEREPLSFKAGGRVADLAILGLATGTAVAALATGNYEIAIYGEVSSIGVLATKYSLQLREEQRVNRLNRNKGHSKAPPND